MAENLHDTNVGNIDYKYIRRQDAVEKCGEWYVEEGPEEGFIGTVSQMLDMFPPADVLPYSIDPDGTLTITVPKGSEVSRVLVQEEGTQWRELFCVEGLFYEN